MSISPLVSYTDFKSCDGAWNYRASSKYNPSGKITKITVHHAAGVTSLQGFSSTLKAAAKRKANGERTRSVSWNYAIDTKGNIGVYVDECNRAWTSSSPSNDYQAVTIEVSNSSTGGNWPVSDASFQALLNLCEDICRRNGIAALTYTGKVAGSNLTRHDWFENKLCPGPYLGSKFPEIVATVNKRLGGPATYDASKISSTAYDNSIGNEATAIYLQHLLGNACPYVATLSSITKSKITKDWKDKANISAVMLEAGNLFDVGHNMLKHFENPLLKDQVKQAKDAGLEWGIYFNSRARTVEEADEELFWLSIVISRFPPFAGVWIHPTIQNDKVKTNQVIAKYHKELVRLGFNSRMGFKLNRSELSKLDWEKHHKDWFLWLEDHLTDISEFTDLKFNLVPQFFVTGE